MSTETADQPAVRQRNTTGSAWTFVGDPPVRVDVGEVHEHPVLLDGWTPVDSEPAPPQAPSKTTTKKRATAADSEGGESR